MLRIVREFSIGRPQIIAGLMLLTFLIQCFWVAGNRRLSDLEFQYIASGHAPKPGQEYRITSPFTGLAASIPARIIWLLRTIAPSSAGATLAVPRPWFLRLPFIAFGFWLGAALWWVARRLFGDEGGYVALALYCFSPAMVMISSNIGPEIILAWSSFGLIYTAIGVAHTVYSPPRKWIPRILLLGLSIGICISTAFWSWTLVLLAFAFMLYLTPGRHRAAVIVFACALAVGLCVVVCVVWFTGATGAGVKILLTPHFSIETLKNLGFALNPDTDGYVSVGLCILALTVYGSWRRSRYFGNTAPLLTAFLMVLLFSLVPAVYLWNSALGLSFLFLFIGGVAADLLETRFRLEFICIVMCAIIIKLIEDFMRLAPWVHTNPV
jgi:Dolichyl-phosphate-mannose-protein mannosyltransferase